MRIQLLADSNGEQKICVIVPHVIKSSFLRNVHGITSTTITQDYCFRLNDLRRRIAILCNDLRSFSLGR